MKKIINGRLYDTETAKELAAVDNGYAKISILLQLRFYWRSIAK